MTMSLRTLCFNIWKSKYDRQGIQSAFKPVFTRYIGTDDSGEFPDILKTLYEKAKDCPYAVFFDRSVPMQAEFELITYISSELQHMDVTNMKSQDIVLFDNKELNQIFLESLDYVVNLALSQEKFLNESTRNDFIMKLIVWTYAYIRPISIHFADSYSPKCFYYGDITRHEIYFLIMLHLMTFDVVYINPLREEYWKEVDRDNLSEQKASQQIMQALPLKEQIKDASVIEEEQSVTLQLQREMEETLLSGSGVYRAWQFRDGYTKPLFIRSTIYDLLSSYAEPARVRSGFKVNGKTVTVPNFLFQIDGVYSDFAEYTKLVDLCISTPNTLVLTDRGSNLIREDVPKQQKLTLAFCRQGDGSFDINELKKLPFYGWDKYRDALEDFILKKINDLFKDCMFKKKFSQEEQLGMVCDILMMDESIIKMADNFDYTDKIPKLVIFLNNEDFIEDRVLYLIGFIYSLGFDVIIFSPAGLISIDSVFEVKRFNNERLDNMQYDLTLDAVKKKSKKKGFFQSLFG